MKVVAPRLVLKTLDEEPRKLPILVLDHLRLTDATGIFQHAKFSLPKFEEGYSTDYTARALLLTAMLEETADDTPAVSTLATIYSAFVNHAFISERRRFHNFMSFDRRWLDEDGSDDCLAHALLALGDLYWTLKARRSAPLGSRTLQPCTADNRGGHLASRLGIDPHCKFTNTFAISVATELRTGFATLSRSAYLNGSMPPVLKTGSGSRPLSAMATPICHTL